MGYTAPQHVPVSIAGEYCWQILLANIEGVLRDGE
jgi:hypothetical protein